MKTRTMHALIAVVLLCVALVSIFGVARIASNPETYAGTISVLNEKRNTAMGLTAAAAAASTAVAFVPSDATTPIANQIMEVSSYLLIVVCMIFLEKFLLTVFGYVSFTFLIPLACVLGAAYQFARKETLKQWAIKLAVFGMVICVMIPTSVRVGEIIENTHKASIAELTAITVEIEEQEQQQETEEVIPEEENTPIQSEEKNWWEKFVGAVKDGAETVKGNAEKVVVKIKEGAGVGVEKAKELFWRFVEGVAVMLVTTCLLPVATMATIIWLAGKIVDITLPTVKRISPRGEKTEEKKDMPCLTEG